MDGSTWGGSWMYHMQEDHMLSIGYVIGLDYENTYLCAATRRGIRSFVPPRRAVWFRLTSPLSSAVLAILRRVHALLGLLTAIYSMYIGASLSHRASRCDAHRRRATRSNDRSHSSACQAKAILEHCFGSCGA